MKRSETYFHVGYAKYLDTIRYEKSHKISKDLILDVKNKNPRSGLHTINDFGDYIIQYYSKTLHTLESRITVTSRLYILGFFQIFLLNKK